MKRIILTLCLAFSAAAASAQYVDDMYDTAPAKPKKPKADNSQIYQPSQSQSPVAQQTTSATKSDNKELITTYQEALERRLNALRNGVDMDDAYWQLMQQYQGILEAKYDKNLYNIVVIGNDMWVEPQVITSLFDGSDPAEGVIQYNNQIKKNLTATNKKPLKEVSSESSSIGSGGNNQTIVINYVVDPWYYSGWNHNFGFSWNYGYGYGWGGGYYDPWYNPWYNPWHRPYYDPWYNPWYRPYYPPVYYSGNPRGTYYGNSASRYSHNQSGGGLGGGTRQPRGADGTTARGYERGRGSMQPTGINTVSGLGNRVSRGEVRGRGNIPTGGVADLRNSGVSFGGFTNSSRPSRGNENPRITVPNMRPTQDNGRFERNTYERPVERPTRNTYERPTRNETYTRPVERPSTFERSTPTIQRPSGGGGFGGGGMGGGTRPTRGR